MLQHAVAAAKSGVSMMSVGSGAATLSRGPDAIYAYKGRPRPPEPAKAPAPKEGAAPAPKPAETPKPAEKPKDGK